jgi:hypothetical protein
VQSGFAGEGGSGTALEGLDSLEIGCGYRGRLLQDSRGRRLALSGHRGILVWDKKMQIAAKISLLYKVLRKPRVMNNSHVLKHRSN